MTKETETDEVQRALAPVSQRNLPILSERFQPRNLTELMSWAKLVTASGLAPKDMNEAGVVLCVQMGAELKISPAQAIQNIAIINGRPSIFGDLGLALFRRDAAIKEFEEDAPDVALENGHGRCKITMADDRVIERRFSIEEAKTAKLWGKQGPWTTYPGRMLMFRSRWWAMRDADPGVFKGCGSGEEAEELVAVTAEGNEITRPRAKAGEQGSGFEKVEDFIGDVGKGPKPGTGGRPAPAPLPEISNPYVATMDTIRRKPGETNGRKWLLYIMKTEDGQEFTTFDKKVFERALKLGNTEPVEIHWEVNRGKRTVKALEPHKAEPPQPEGPGFSDESKNPPDDQNLFKDEPK
jgi:hypothetical protein